jgi:hypothetical protein
VLVYRRSTWNNRGHWISQKLEYARIHDVSVAMGWFKGKVAGNPPENIGNPWFPVDILVL